MSVSKNDTIYVVTDPLRGKMDGDIHTEEQGRLRYGSSDYMAVKNPNTAKEIKERRPWMLVTPTTDADGVLGGVVVCGFRSKPLDEEQMRKDGWVKDGASWKKVGV